MRYLMLVGVVFCSNVFAADYSAERIYESLSVDEFVVDTGVNVGKVLGKSAGGLTCIKSTVNPNRTNYACGVDNAKTLQILSIWTPQQIGPAYETPEGPLR